MQVIIDNLPMYASGLLRTVHICLYAVVLALILGTIAAGFRVSPLPPLRAAGTSWVNVLRNCPLTVVLFFMAFGLPELGLNGSYFWFGTIGLALYTSAFVCEAIRSGINTVPTGQAEAARSIGLGFMQTLRFVVLPQAFRGAIAPLGNTFIALTKNTTVAVAIGVPEVSYLMRGMIEFNSSLLFFIFLLLSFGFVVLTLPVGVAFTGLSRRLAVRR